MPDHQRQIHEMVDSERSDRPPLTIAGWYALARISIWGLYVWRPKTQTKAALVMLNDPPRSSLNPRIVTLLLGAGLLQEVGGTLVATTAGIEALGERPDVMARMRAEGVI